MQKKKKTKKRKTKNKKKKNHLNPRFFFSLDFVLSF